MAFVGHEKNRDRVRVSIGHSDLSRWGMDDQAISLVKHWISLGRERSDLKDHFEMLVYKLREEHAVELEKMRDQMDFLQEKLSKLAEFSIQISISLMKATTLDHYELERINYKKKHSSLDKDEQGKATLAANREIVVRRLAEDLFPELAVSLSNPSRGDKDA